MIAWIIVGVLAALLVWAADRFGRATLELREREAYYRQQMQYWQGMAVDYARRLAKAEGREFLPLPTEDEGAILASIAKSYAPAAGPWSTDIAFPKPDPSPEREYYGAIMVPHESPDDPLSSRRRGSAGNFEELNGEITGGVKDYSIAFWMDDGTHRRCPLFSATGQQCTLKRSHRFSENVSPCVFGDGRE